MATRWADATRALRGSPLQGLRVSIDAVGKPVGASKEVKSKK
jgi:hypothetical protein